jgi:hypothetical protein
MHENQPSKLDLQGLILDDADCLTTSTPQQNLTALNEAGDLALLL